MIRQGGERFETSHRSLAAVGTEEYSGFPAPTFVFAHLYRRAMACPIICFRVTTQLATLLQDVLGPGYRLEHELEAGGMSRLFLATDVALKRQVVVKVLPPDLVSATSIARFRREIELTVQLQHPHILPIITSGSWDDGLYYITPFIAGEGLRNRILREGSLPLESIVRILRDVSDALAFAHAQLVVHRDIKPGNILLADGQAILADFGIARAVSTTATPLTGSGVTPGTPGYMAPELPTDERADVYALGVVAYEMLCGRLPGGAVRARDIVETRGKVHGDSRAAIARLSLLVARTLSSDPTNRITTASAFSDTLRDVPPSRRAPWVGLAFTAGLASMLGFAGWQAWRSVIRMPLDPGRYLVIAVGKNDSLKDETVARATEALDEWRGVRTADANLLPTALRRNDKAVRLGDVWPAARSLGAGRVIAIDATERRDSILVKATLYDASGDSALRAIRATFVRREDEENRQVKMRGLINGLLRDGDELPWRDASDHVLPSLEAWRSYDAGRAALRRWDLEAAERSFRDATARESEHLSAQLWLAQTLQWASVETPLESRTWANRVFDRRRSLGPRDSIHAVALYHLVDSDFAEACENFARLVSRDSTDIVGWTGLGDCSARDRVVRRDPRSRTGWSFRGSYEQAARDYQKAAEFGPPIGAPAFHGWVLGRLTNVLYSVTNRVRFGFLANSETTAFAALPFLDHDTLAFAPYDARYLGSGRDDPSPTSVKAAVNRNRNLLRRSAEEWVRYAPDNAAAYDSLAGWMEVSGGYATVGGRSVSTLDVLRKARSLSVDRVEQVRLAVSEVRLRLKSEEFSAARLEADSVLRSVRGERVSAVAGLAGLAALVGHLEEAATLLGKTDVDRRIHLPDGRIVQVSAQLSELSSRLLAYASLGASTDSVRSMARRTMDLTRSYFPDSATAEQVKGSLVGSALSLAYPVAADLLNEIAPQPDETTKGYVMLFRGDTAGARRTLVRVKRMNQGKDPGTAVDRNLRRARLALMLGDTASAIEELDPVLRALPTLGPSLLDQTAQIASLIRSFALRAEIANRAKDHSTITRCAQVVITLWATSDVALQPVVTRMKSLLQPAG